MKTLYKLLEKRGLLQNEVYAALLKLPAKWHETIRVAVSTGATSPVLR